MIAECDRRGLVVDVTLTRTQLSSKPTSGVGLQDFHAHQRAVEGNDDQRKTVIGMTVLAWNMAVFPEPERWEGMSPEFAEQLWKHGEAILKKMIERKLTLYPQESRSILDYEITGSGDNLRIEVAFSLLPEEIANLNHGNQGIEAR